MRLQHSTSPKLFLSLFIGLAGVVLGFIQNSQSPQRLAGSCYPSFILSNVHGSKSRVGETPNWKFSSSASFSSNLRMTDSLNNNNPELNTSKTPFWFDPNTKGGALVLALVLFIVPVMIYNVLIAFGMDDVEAGIDIGIGFTIVSCLGWVSTYVFRVATKDMTYARQLKDYENAVIAKRLEELDEDEVQALVEEVERDNF